MNAARFALVAACCLASLPAWAAAEDPAVRGSVPQVGARTEALLELQRSQRQAGRSQPLRGKQAEAARRRYQNSFGHPIPDQYPATPSAAGAAAAK